MDPTDAIEPAATTAFRRAVLAAIGGAVADVPGTDWDDANAVGLAEKRVRILTALAATIDKAGVADDRDHPIITPEEDAANKAELRRRVVLIQGRLGVEPGADRGSDDPGDGEGGRDGVGDAGAPGPEAPGV